MRISDWSADVCSSDLCTSTTSCIESRPSVPSGPNVSFQALTTDQPNSASSSSAGCSPSPSSEYAPGVTPPTPPPTHQGPATTHQSAPDRKSVVSVKRLSVRVDLCGSLIIKNTK